MISNINALTSTDVAPVAGRGMDQLGQGDFLRLLTVQIQQQDPFDPVDNKEMLAQMAQFSSLAGVAETNETLTLIAERIDKLTLAQQNAQNT